MFSWDTNWTQNRGLNRKQKVSKKYVSVCISLYQSVSVCISLYQSVSACVSMYQFVSVCISLYQSHQLCLSESVFKQAYPKLAAKQFKHKIF
jgi:hypothetical protein